MKRALFGPLVFVTSMAAAYPACADQAYKCALASGEVLFTSRPCAPVGATDQHALTDQQSERLGEIEQKIAALKFDLLETDMAYSENQLYVSVEDRGLFEAVYEQRRAALTTDLRRLDWQRSDLMGKMGSDLGVRVMLMGQSN